MLAKLISTGLVTAFFFQSSLALAAKTEAPKENQPILTYTIDKPNITVSASQPEFILRLKSNPSTGYSWFLREYNAALITPVKHVYEQSKTDKGMVGTPGYELWTFRVNPAAFAVPQQTLIRFIYARPWQGSDNASQAIFTVSTSRN